MGIIRERASTYLDLRASQQVTKPRIRSFVLVGVFWGALMGVLMQWFSGDGFSGWVFLYWLMVGIVGFGPGAYWLALRKWRSNEE